MYALNIGEENRILSACKVLGINNYKEMPIVYTLPDGDIYDYKYIEGKYVYDPLPKAEENEDIIGDQ